MYFGIREGNARIDQLVGPYEYLAQRRILFLSGPIVPTHDMPMAYTRQDAFSASVIADALMVLNDVSEEPIWLVINSPGGNVDQGLVLYDAIKTSSAPVHVLGRNCYSMAAIIFSAGERGHRYAFPNSSFMLHLPFGRAEGDAKEIAIKSKEMDKLKNKIIDELVDNGIKLTKKKLLQEIDREKWLSAEEAIRYGLVDKIVEKGTLKFSKSNV